MTDNKEYYMPGGDGKWDNPTIPNTLKEAQERIKVLQSVLMYYSDARTYNPDSQDNEYPFFRELIDDKGIRARIGRLAMNTKELKEWQEWAIINGHMQ
jgi:hypothetical protein